MKVGFVQTTVNWSRTGLGSMTLNRARDNCFWRFQVEKSELRAELYGMERLVWSGRPCGSTSLHFLSNLSAIILSGDIFCDEKSLKGFSFKLLF